MLVMEKKLDNASLKIFLIGNLMGDEVAKFHDFVNPLLVQTDIKEVILDANGVSYVDSMGIGALMQLNKKLSSLNIPMKMVNLREFIYSSLMRFNIDRFFPITMQITEDSSSAKN